MSRLIFTAFGIILIFSLSAQDKSDWVYEFPDGCTSITVGKEASADGSVITSHTDDSHRTRSWADVVPARDYKKNDMAPMYKREACYDFEMPTNKHVQIGEIPQVRHTFAFLNTAYPCMNEHQLGIGESTFGGRSELHSDQGLIDCQRLCRLMLERNTTARDAIKMAGELIKQYGWNDSGECLTIADPDEVWHLEVVGPGKGKTGGVWVAQRVPDDHVACNVNASTIRDVDLSNPDYFMASENIYEVARENGWWKDGETFRWCYVYAPGSRKSVASRRREWRIFDLLAPSLELDPNAQDYPFSVKPDKPVSMEKLISIFKDYYEGTPYDMRRNITVKDKEGKQVISPLANPFMPYEELPLHNVSGGWYHVDKKSGNIDFLGERTIARWYTMYATIIQCRDWLPDAIGGLVWLAQDNVASSVYVPIYCSVTDLPEPYKTPGRPNGYTTKSAWWAFNRLGTLAAQRWGDMHKDLDAVWGPMQQSWLQNQADIEQKALILYKQKPDKAIEYLNSYSNEQGAKAVDQAWKLGDKLWTKYDEKF